MDLGKSLRIAVAMKGIKQKELAENFGTSRQQISNWMNTGIIKQSNLVKICEFFGMKVSEFIALGEK